jgi:plasmid stabilization system protein ParE
VVVTENAKSNLRSYYERAAQEAPETAAAWLTRFESALESLSDNPAKCILAPENELVTKLAWRLVTTFHPATRPP